jgi:uncharacterized protein (DUF433 family)
MEFAENNSALLQRITINPKICHGKPTVRGLRYPVESLLEYLAADDTTEEILTESPDLEKEDLQAITEALETCSLVEVERRDQWISKPMGAKIDLSDKDALYRDLDKE